MARKRLPAEPEGAAPALINQDDPAIALARLKAAIRERANAINSDLSIVFSLLWVIRYSPAGVTDADLAVFVAAAERIAASAAGLSG